MTKIGENQVVLFAQLEGCTPFVAGILIVSTCTKCTEQNVTYFALLFKIPMYCVLRTFFVYFIFTYLRTFLQMY